MIVGYIHNKGAIKGGYMMAGTPSYKELQDRVQELELAEANQSTQKNTLKKLFDLSLDMLCVANFDGYFQFINPAFERTLGYSRQELLKYPFVDFIHADDIPATQAAVEQLAAGKSVTNFENRYRCKDGSYKWLAWTSVPVTDERCMYAVARNISESRQIAEEVQRCQREMAHIMRLGTMGEMASGMAHELNQPLTALVSYCGTAISLVNSLSSPPQQLNELLERAKVQAHRASNIIRNLREFVSKGDNHKEILELDRVIRGILILLKFEVQEAGVTIEYYPDYRTCKVMVDKIQIDQVLINMVRNSMEAIRHSKITDGQIAIHTRLLPKDRVEVTVADNGPGIDADMVGKIFSPFQTSKEKGMGIGLSLSRRIIEAHGGKLWVDEDYQNGALFGFELPVSK
jgi:two-component system sensor histidine kinase TtrS